MRLNYYRFPDDAPVAAMIENGCEGIRTDGRTVHWWNIDEGVSLVGVTVTDKTLEGIRISKAKELLKQYGGSAWTEHCERDGGCFEVTEIKIKGNNSRFKYNHHL